MSLPTVNAIWIGPELGPLHVACLHSFVRAGHRMVLHCYAPPADLPAGVETADARALMSEDRIFLHRKSGSYAIAVDLMRIEISRLGFGLYVDCDIYCLHPVEDADYIFGRQGNESIGNSVLKLPEPSPLLTEFCRIKDEGAFVPPWFRPSKRRWHELRRRLGRPMPISRLPWGAIGPDALTWYARRHGVAHLAAPSDVYYPIAHYQFDRLFDPELTIEDLTTHRTRFIHLFNEMFRREPLRDIPPSSPAGRMIAAAGDALPERYRSGGARR